VNVTHYASGRARGVILASAVVTIGACSDPELRSDLRPGGAPELLTVTVQNDYDSGYVEAATFCKLNDEKRPTEVFLNGGAFTVVCPLDPAEGVPMVTDALPTGWYARLVFDELLDPDVEELIPNRDPVTMEETGTFRGSIATTQPVTLSCGGVDVPYDGYYNPAGNYQTWPLGPSLVVVPDDPTSVPTGTTCEISILDVVTDKNGEVVPAAQRGPYQFQISALGLLSTDPVAVSDPEAQQEIVPTSPATLTFNAPIDIASFTAADVQIFRGADEDDCTGGTAVGNASVRVFQAEDEDGAVVDPLSVQIADGSATGAAVDPADPADLGNRFEPSTTYRIEFMNSMIADIAGGEGTIELGDDGGDPPVPNILCFTTGDGT
jgi:hypothetical protein